MHQLLRDEGDRLTLEQTGVTFWINREEIDELSQLPPLRDEIEYYSDLHDELFKQFATQSRVSRRVVVVDPRCISFLQLLRGRHSNLLMVAARSMDTSRLPSDLGFLAREARALGADRIVLSIGSLHTVLR